jgi:hypothetical protein
MIIVQRNRILLSGLKEETHSSFIKLNTIFNKKFTYGYETLWTALHEIKIDGKFFLCVPRGYTYSELKKYVEDDGEVIKDPSHIEYREASFNLNIEPRDEIQKDILTFLHGTENYKDIKDKARRAVFADTGIGKTFITLKYISESKLFTCIMCPEDKSIKTWMQELEKFTDVKHDEIGIIKGSDSLNKIIKNKDKYKIVLVSNKTISSLFESKRFDEVYDFFNTMQFGLKVIDEVHLHLKTVFFLEMTVNLYKTFYLTATDNRRIFKENEVLKRMMPEDSCVYRQPTVKKFEFYSVEYYSNPKDRKHVRGIEKPNGFDGLLYLKYILNESLPYKDFYIEKVLLPSLRIAFKVIKNEPYKVAILFKSIDAGNIIVKYLQDNNCFPGKSIGVFNSTISDIHLRMLELDKDIIVSTDKSFSGMINIKGLAVIINCLPITSIAHIKQIMGRLRDEGTKRRVFIQHTDRSFKKAAGMVYREKKIVEDICTSMEVIKVNTADIYTPEEE